MELVEVELHTGQGNFAVLRLPARRFPGMLFQGDSLSVLRDDVARVRAALHAGDLEAAREETDDLLAELDGLLRAYIAVLDRTGVTLPFPRPTSAGPGG